MTKRTLAEIMVNNSKWISKAKNLYLNIGFIKNECIQYLMRHTKEMIEDEKQAECLIFTKILYLEKKGNQIPLNGEIDSRKKIRFKCC